MEIEYWPHNSIVAQLCLELKQEPKGQPKYIHLTNTEYEQLVTEIGSEVPVLAFQSIPIKVSGRDLETEFAGFITGEIAQKTRH